MSWGPSASDEPRVHAALARALPEPPEDDPWFRNGGVRAQAACPLPWETVAERCALPSAPDHCRLPWTVEVEA